MKNIMKKIISMLMIAALLMGLAACGSKTEPVAESAQFDASSVSTPAPTESQGLIDLPEASPQVETVTGPINPLTGEAASEDTLAARPYAVMVNNIIVAQPQIGVSQADMVYELMEEGGITRMMAFFTDMGAVEKVGSVRSARLYNVSTAQAFDAFLVHAGGSDEALSYISANGIQDIDGVKGKYTGETFYRDPDRQAYGIEHSMFASGPAIVQSAADLGYSATHRDGYDASFGLTFSEAADEQCTAPAGVVEVVYAGGKTTSFTYDESAGLYTAHQYDGVYTDGGETPMTFKNVIVVNANTYLQSDGLHLTIDLTGTGDGYFCCGGKYVPIRWSRNGLNDNFHYTLEDGSQLALGVGKTFVAVQQVGSYSGTTNFRES